MYTWCKNKFWGWKRNKKIVSNASIFCFISIKKPIIKGLKNIDLRHELPFYYELSIEKIWKTLKRCARSYRIEIIDWNDPLVQLQASKSSIKDLFKDLLDEIKGFKYQILVKVLYKKHKENGGMEFAPVFFNYTTKTVINSDKYMPDKSVQEIL